VTIVPPNGVTGRRYARTTEKRAYPKLNGPKSAGRQVAYTTSPFARLALAHAVGVCGDLFVTVALADSLFFSATTSGSRAKVLGYLALTMAPFVVIAPLLGPALDRTKGGRRLLFMATGLLRGVLCVVMANHIDDLWLYPLAFAALVCSKSQNIAKAALVPAVVEREEELVLANSRLALIGVLGGTIAAPIAGLFLKVAGGDWVLRFGALVFFAGGVLALAIPKADKVGRDETVADRAALHVPSIIAAGSAMGFVRGAVGFMTFFGAFVLKEHEEPAWVFGLLIATSAVGNGIGTLLAPQLRRRFREESIMVGSMVIPGVMIVFAARGFGRPWLAIAAAMVAGGTACGRLAFDSLVQRDAHDAARGRAFARFETRFQLVWVSGGVLAVLFPSYGRGGLFVIALVMLFSGLTYLGAVRRLDRERAEALYEPDP
jgi:MFS family permease